MAFRKKTIHVVVYQIGSLGDTLVTIPAYRAIRRHFGAEATISVLHNIPSDSRATASHVLAESGLVDSFIGFSVGARQNMLKSWLGLWPRLLKLRADAVVNLGPWNRSPAEVWRDRLFFSSCGIYRKFGFHAFDPALTKTRDKQGKRISVPHVTQLHLDRLRKDGIQINVVSDMQMPLLSVSAYENNQIREWIQKQNCVVNGSLVAICPGANQPAKFWPIEHFVEIGKRLIAEGYVPVIIGGPQEKSIGDTMLAEWEGGINAVGQFSVMGSAAFLSQCRFLVGLDTGTTHLAAAVGVPCVALYADRDPQGQWLPLGQGHTIINHSVPCGGCRLRECSVDGHPCMQSITVEEVWSAILKTIQQTNDAVLITA